MIGVELVGIAQGPAVHAHQTVSDWPTAAAFAREAHFSEHHLVVRADDQHDPAYEKAACPAARAARQRERCSPKYLNVRNVRTPSAAYERT